jgi:uncharacterized protein YfkK (UPF0435 family)
MNEKDAIIKADIEPYKREVAEKLSKVITGLIADGDYKNASCAMHALRDINQVIRRVNANLEAFREYL